MNKILKLYGLTKAETEEKLSDVIEKNKQSIKISIKEKYLDISLDISGEDEDNINAVIKQIFDKCKSYIYSDSYTTLYEKLAEVLEVRGKKLCIMEQGSGGVITTNLLAIANADKYIVASLVLPSADSWLTRFDIDPKMLSANNGISSKLVFSIASALRRTYLADYYVVCISSDASGLEVYNLDKSQDNYIYSLVAIGDPSGVDIFKIALSGDKRDRNNQTAKAIAHKLITELKK